MTEFEKNVDNVNYEPKTYTENGSIAFGWNNNEKFDEKCIREKIVQYYFQSVLNKDLNYTYMVEKYENLLDLTSNNEKYLDYVLRLTLQTRDIHYGKGICGLSYRMLECLVYYCYELKKISKEKYYKIMNQWVQEFETNQGTQEDLESSRLLQEFEIINNDGEEKEEKEEEELNHFEPKKELPYGSWKDLKIFLDYLKKNSYYNFQDKYGIILDHINELYVKQMVKDKKSMSISEPISLCGKWLPRESSNEYKWLAKMIAKEYYFRIYHCYSNVTSFVEYRKICASFNKYLDTTQVHMCNRTWDKIIFNHVTGKTLFKFQNSFLNYQNIQEDHRNVCKQNFKEFIENKIRKNESMKGGTLFPHELVKQYMKYKNDKNKQNDQSEQNEKNNQNEDVINIMNLQWKGMVEEIKNKSKEENFLKYCIPCIDVSPSMYSKDSLPIESSIGMGLLAMECSTIKRAFTFSETPKWIKLNETNSFTENVNEVLETEWGATTDIVLMFQLFLNICKEKQISDEELQKYSLMIFSDMQFNECSFEMEKYIMDSVKKMFYSIGYTTYPYLIFWNLRTTDNFPSIEKTPGCTKLSGNSASLFKFFLNTTLDEIKQMTNWSLIEKILSNERYNI